MPKTRDTSSRPALEPDPHTESAPSSAGGGSAHGYLGRDADGEGWRLYLDPGLTTYLAFAPDAVARTEKVEAAGGAPQSTRVFFNPDATVQQVRVSKQTLPTEFLQGVGAPDLTGAPASTYGITIACPVTLLPHCPVVTLPQTCPPRTIDLSCHVTLSFCPTSYVHCPSAVHCPTLACPTHFLPECRPSLFTHCPTQTCPSSWAAYCPTQTCPETLTCPRTLTCPPQTLSCPRTLACPQTLACPPHTLACPQPTIVCPHPTLACPGPTAACP